MIAAAPAAAEDSSFYELVDAAAQRLQTAEPVAATKWLAGTAVTDQARAEQVLDTVSAEAESRGVPGDFTRRVFTDLINANEAVQYSRFAAWKLDPAAAPNQAPDLASSRRLIDQLNAVIVNGLAQQAPALSAPDCPAHLDWARSLIADTRQFDDLYRRALDSATRSFCSG